MPRDPYAPAPADRFTFGLWTVGNTGRDPFGEPTRPRINPRMDPRIDPRMEPGRIVELLGEVGGVYGVNYHDNDLIPIDATPAEAAAIERDFRKALRRTGLRVVTVTANLFSDPAFKDGAFTSSDAAVRAYALQKSLRCMEQGKRLGARYYLFWGGREGLDTNAGKDPVQAIHRLREAIDFLCEHNRAQRWNYRILLEAKPNEPRGHIFMPVTGSYLGFISTLKFPGMVGVNPEFAHEQMAGLNFVNVVAEALEAGKLFHIDLNDQEPGRFDQDLRFGSASIKHAFYLVKLLMDHGYAGPKHFDSHAYRTSDERDVKHFARGSMRTYKILEAKVRQFNRDRKIQALIRKINRQDARLARVPSAYSRSNAATLLAMNFDRKKLAARPLPYEELDQRVLDLLLGI